MKMKIATDCSAARKRVFRFFDQPRYERRAVYRVIKSLDQLGHAYIFGGSIRDIILLGGNRLNSDIDLAINVGDRRGFADFLRHHHAQRNKFGGYRIKIDRWFFDIWETRDTWAFVEGIVNYKTPISLLQTTFFNWDAIFYDVKNKRLHFSEDYFESIKSKFLEINLAENPNKMGAFVRSLRIIISHEQIVTGPILTDFIKSRFDRVEDTEILNYEQKSFPRTKLTREFLSHTRKSMPTLEGGSIKEWQASKQPDLFSLHVPH